MISSHRIPPIAKYIYILTEAILQVLYLGRGRELTKKTKKRHWKESVESKK